MRPSAGTSQDELIMLVHTPIHHEGRIREGAGSSPSSDTRKMKPNVDKMFGFFISPGQ
ncbi:hypothetical protein Dtox_3379 [Desulfofarcimen acetoxidans DSM 771]|uniref:Uncharacterized protein n=1 Tax=Desulfofarcimen acetoxidans (strain ATCC 49208 / DSM 771 / KCTC 5769 / VKM B-1644 / 5575) TaxID=485916 RepID=C8W6K0_DESAS|nr:hypothetical protein [Desulfofarcimen acetoxidans]ACV64109.1 hypothetical protein Dtox_3379 [Desulfofarcimen acetoxidans DSM 771]